MVHVGEPKSERRYVVLAIAVFVVSLFIYLQTLAPAVSTIFDDSLEFQLVSYQLGIAHPTGYPLYTLMGKLFTSLPVGTIAYRVNLLSALCGALTATGVSLIVAKVSGRHLAGLAAGAVFVVLGEVLDHAYRNSTQVIRSLGLPILDAIDEIITSQDRRRLLVKRAVMTPLVVAACLGLVVISGSMAYLSLHRPSTYQRIQHIPQDAMHLFADVGTPQSEGTVASITPES